MGTPVYDEQAVRLSYEGTGVMPCRNSRQWALGRLEGFHSFAHRLRLDVAPQAESESKLESSSS